MVKIKKQSLVDQIYSRLREDILSLKLPLGSRINVNEIQGDLGVSSTPLREALNRLQQDGLVTFETNVGASVLSLDEHDVNEIDELAFALQTAAVRFALKRGDRTVISQKVAEQVARYNAARTSRECAKAFFDLIGIFYHNCGNQRLDKSMIAIQGQVVLLRRIYAECPGSSDNQDLLEQILDGVSQNDPDMILDALQEYSDRSRPAILHWLETHQN